MSGLTSSLPALAPSTMADCASPLSSSSDKPLIPPLTLPTNGASASLPLSTDATDEVIPPVHTHRTIVLCFDGTGDQFDSDVSASWDTYIFCLMSPPSAELEHYPVFLHVEEGRPLPTDGLLSG